MIRNYLKLALRNLFKRKVYTLINVLGLATGMAICMLIVLFIKSETGYDQHHQKHERIYRMVVDRKYPGRATSYSFIPQSYAAAVKQEFPGVLETVRIYNFIGNGSFQLTYEDKKFEEKRALFADSNFFKVFTAKILAGDATTALSKPQTVVINETTAKKYFGTVANAIGKALQPEGNERPPLEVTAVCADWPENAHFTFDFLLTTAGNQNFTTKNFVNFAAHTYLLLDEHTSAKDIQAKFPLLIEKYAAGNIEKQFEVPFKQFQAAGNGYNYYLQPLKDIHLTSHLEGELKPNGSLQAIYIFSVVAVFIMLIACINFINLSTARSTERAKEVGVRKTFGSEKKSLIGQFLTESTLLSIISMLLAIGLAFLLLPMFNQIAGKELHFLDFLKPSAVSVLLLLTLITGLAAGLYPAFVLSSFRPIQVLKGKFKSGTYGLALRNGLVIFQFAISVILIVSTIIINSQMNFMTGEKLGFDKEHTIVIENTDLLEDQTKAFGNELMKIAGVEHVSGSSAVPGSGNFFGVSWREQSSKEPLTGRGIIADDQFHVTLGLELTEGRFFSKDFPTDSLALVLNEKAVTEMGLKNPIGARLTSSDEFYNAPDGSLYIYTVIGVVKDFHYQSLHQPITPLVFNNASKFRNITNITSVRIKGENFKQAVEGVEKTWKTFIKERPFQYSFLDQTIAAQYHAESRTQKLFTFFASLAIFIACIGLLGLAAYTTQQRTHEIGIRKVLGASTGNIVGMLSKDFLKLIIVAVIIAFPVAWFLMNKWLQDFTYRVNIAWWMFIIAGVAAILVALFTISFQAVKAALANPVKSLRTE